MASYFQVSCIHMLHVSLCYTHQNQTQDGEPHMDNFPQRVLTNNYTCKLAAVWHSKELPGHHLPIVHASKLLQKAYPLPPLDHFLPYEEFEGLLGSGGSDNHGCGTSKSVWYWGIAKTTDSSVSRWAETMGSCLLTKGHSGWMGQVETQFTAHTCVGYPWRACRIQEGVHIRSRLVACSCSLPSESCIMGDPSQPPGFPDWSRKQIGLSSCLWVGLWTWHSCRLWGSESMW